MDFSVLFDESPETKTWKYVSSAHANLLAKVTNAEGRYIGQTTSSMAGALSEDTVACVSITAITIGNPMLRACFFVYDSGAQQWYSSYHYYPLIIEGGKLKINGVFLED